jgi:hypothetical protein
MREVACAAAAVLLVAASACGDHSGSRVATTGESGLGALHVGDGGVTITRRGGPDARISADGRLTVGSQEVAVNDAQRAQLVAYYASATALVEHAKATGRAGAAVGAAAVTEVVSGLVKGDTSQIGAKVELKANAVKQEARMLCDAAASLRATQSALSADLIAFRPYAVIRDDQSNCKKD